MSYSVCIKCEKMVSQYEKYCDTCVAQFHLQEHQDVNFHRTFSPKGYKKECAEIFKRDLQAVEKRDNIEFCHVCELIRPILKYDGVGAVCYQCCGMTPPKEEMIKLGINSFSADLRKRFAEKNKK